MPSDSHPPPPPPPPPLPSMDIYKEKEKESIADIIRKNRKGGGQRAQLGSQAAKPTMADVLSKLGTVKLKTVQRSPGGTPMRPTGASRAPPAAPMDPAAMIAMALKRKFSKTKVTSGASPATDWDAKENAMREARKAAKQIEEDSQPKFGLHMLKKSKHPRAPLSPMQQTTGVTV
eukprot:m.997233 g.997233  ORF g.997233 m.997233 type:complete len:175 (-) comp24021_c0_seq23:209-733(-)